MKIDFDDFYHEWPMKKPVSVEKYYLNDGRVFDTRQMTYSFIDENESGLEPTFEISDVIQPRNSEELYVIVEIDRYASEIYAELLDEKTKRTGRFTHFEESDVYHKLNNVEWV